MLSSLFATCGEGQLQSQLAGRLCIHALLVLWYIREIAALGGPDRLRERGALNVPQYMSVYHNLDEVVPVERTPACQGATI